MFLVPKSNNPHIMVSNQTIEVYNLWRSYSVKTDANGRADFYVPFGIYIVQLMQGEFRSVYTGVVFYTKKRLVVTFNNVDKKDVEVTFELTSLAVQAKSGCVEMQLVATIGDHALFSGLTNSQCSLSLNLDKQYMVLGNQMFVQGMMPNSVFHMRLDFT